MTNKTASMSCIPKCLSNKNKSVQIIRVVMVFLSLVTMNDYASFLLHSSQATEEYIFTVWFHGKRTIVTVTSTTQKRTREEPDKAEPPFVLNVSVTANYRWFSSDVIASMLVHRPIEQNSFGNLTLLSCKT